MISRGLVVGRGRRVGDWLFLMVTLLLRSGVMFVILCTMRLLILIRRILWRRLIMCVMFVRRVVLCMRRLMRCIGIRGRLVCMLLWRRVVRDGRVIIMGLIWCLRLCLLLRSSWMLLCLFRLVLMMRRLLLMMFCFSWGRMLRLGVLCFGLLIVLCCRLFGLLSRVKCRCLLCFGRRLSRLFRGLRNLVIVLVVRLFIAVVIRLLIGVSRRWFRWMGGRVVLFV